MNTVIELNGGKVEVRGEACMPVLNNNHNTQQQHSLSSSRLASYTRTLQKNKYIHTVFYVSAEYRCVVIDGVSIIVARTSTFIFGVDLSSTLIV